MAKFIIEEIFFLEEKLICGPYKSNENPEYKFEKTSTFLVKYGNKVLGKFKSYDDAMSHIKTYLNPKYLKRTLKDQEKYFKRNIKDLKDDFMKNKKYLTNKLKELKKFK